ncbi:MAG: 4Fe-4S dicluster domain-containing protein [Candidatus Caldatribacteriota bacterium]|nr:4Fe-4S dicluster domain-containing protein [Candidatus Caldatribacteriota bacterium]
MKLESVLKDMGVVGAGGAGFPTHIKVSNKCDTVIANGVECEPLLSNDKYIIETEGEKIVEGLKAVMQAVGAKKGIIALKEKYYSIAGEIKKTISSNKNISLHFLGDYYPAGDEFLLTYEVTRKIIPEGGIPPDVGCIVNNVETLKNIHAATEGKPVTRRMLTCTGEVKTPGIINAHIGTPFREIIDLCEPTLEDFVVIVGGPMMGKVESNLDTPVTKTTTGIIVLPRDHPLIYKKTLRIEHIIKQSKSACCQCSYCTDLCPRYLLGHELYPHKIMRQINLGIDIPSEIIQNAFLCSECGLCEVFACPMGLSPRIINQKIKENLLAAGYKPKFSNKENKEIKPREMREFRKVPGSRIKNRLMLSKYDENSGHFKRGIKTNPKLVEILLKQHAGVFSEPIVKIGEQVDEGTLIAEIPKGKLGARIHSSIKGKVTYIDSEKIIITKK